jgi:hypothetical protein
VYEFVEFHWAVVRVFYGEQTLPGVQQLPAMCGQGEFVLLSLRVIREKPIPDIVQMSVHVQMCPFRERSMPRLMRQPYSAIHHRIAAEIETVLYVELRTFAVVVPAYQNFLTRPLGDGGHEHIRLPYAYVSQMYQQVPGFHCLMDILIQPLREILWTVTPRFYPFVVQVRVGYQVSFHEIILSASCFSTAFVLELSSLFAKSGVSFHALYTLQKKREGRA